MHYSWESQEAFDLWHEGVMQALGIPHANKNLSSGRVDKKAQWTLSYTILNVTKDNILYAKVEDEIAQQFPDNLGEQYDYQFEFEI